MNFEKKVGIKILSILLIIVNFNFLFAKDNNWENYSVQVKMNGLVPNIFAIKKDTGSDKAMIIEFAGKYEQNHNNVHYNKERRSNDYLKYNYDNNNSYISLLIQNIWYETTKTSVLGYWGAGLYCSYFSQSNFNLNVEEYDYINDEGNDYYKLDNNSNPFVKVGINLVKGFEKYLYDDISILAEINILTYMKIYQDIDITYDTYFRDEVSKYSTTKRNLKGFGIDATNIKIGINFCL